jgi:hypothetical protein
MHFMSDPRHRNHYGLAHEILPGIVSESGPQLMIGLMTKGGGPVAEIWDELSHDAGLSADRRPSDFSVIGPDQDKSLCLYETPTGSRLAFVFLQMPEVRAPLESEIGTFVWDVESNSVRYFTLEVEMSFDGAVTPNRILCEWSNGNHLNYGPVNAESLADLRDGILRQLAN